MIRLLVAAWMGTANNWRGMTSLSRRVSASPFSYAWVRCTINDKASDRLLVDQNLELDQSEVR